MKRVRFEREILAIEYDAEGRQPRWWVVLARDVLISLISGALFVGLMRFSDAVAGK